MLESTCTRKSRQPIIQCDEIELVQAKYERLANDSELVGGATGPSVL